jgi:hypothetical protein
MCLLESEAAVPPLLPLLMADGVLLEHDLNPEVLVRVDSVDPLLLVSELGRMAM